MSLRPIETRYKGYRFRSRTEARWAVFFDTFGVPWEYEPQGYVCADGRGYLPDFRIDNAVLFEVKPSLEPFNRTFLEDLAESRRKWAAFLATSPETPLLVAFGQPGGMDGVPRAMRFYADRSGERLTLAECRRCGGIGWTLHDEDGAQIGGEMRCQQSCASERWPIVGEKTRRAVMAARSARFEHGESGAG